jgi:hypothetical protein
LTAAWQRLCSSNRRPPPTAPTHPFTPSAPQIDASEIVRVLFMKGIMLSMNQQLDKNTIKLVAQEYELLVVDKVGGGRGGGGARPAGPLLPAAAGCGAA